MNFIAAIQLATVGLNVRRKAWGPAVTIGIVGFGCLEWTNNSVYKPVHLLGNDAGISMTEEDIKATDWEVLDSNVIVIPS